MAGQPPTVCVRALAKNLTLSVEVHGLTLHGRERLIVTLLSLWEA